MVFDYGELEGRIIEKFGSKIVFAENMGFSEITLLRRLNNRTAWKQDEIYKVIQFLELKNEDIQVYFFKDKVQNIELYGERL